MFSFAGHKATSIWIDDRCLRIACVYIRYDNVAAATTMSPPEASHELIMYSFLQDDGIIVPVLYRAFYIMSHFHNKKPRRN